MSNPEMEQMSAAQKASAEVLMTLMRTSFEGMQRLAELNMAAARETFSSNVATVSKLAASRDVGEMARANQELARPERMMEYWRNVYDLVSAMQKDVTRGDAGELHPAHQERRLRHRAEKIVGRGRQRRDRERHEEHARADEQGVRQHDRRSRAR